MALSIRYRILLAIVLPAMCLLLTFSGLVYLRVAAHRTADLDRELYTRAVAFAALVERDDGRWLFEDAAPPLASLRLVDGLSGWRVILPDGTPLVGGGDVSPWPAGAAPASADGVSTTILVDGRPARSWTGQLLVQVENEASNVPVPVTVGVSRDLAPFSAELRQLLLTLIAVGLLLAGVGAAVGVALSGRIVASLDRIAQLAGQVRADKRPTRLPRNGTGDELDRLTDALDAAFARAHDAWAQQARFTGDASHELRTPLTVIGTAAEVALRRERSPDQYRDALTAIGESATRMQETVEGLLLLARADAGALRDGWAHEDLTTLGAKAVERRRDDALARQIHLRSPAPVPAPFIGHAPLLRVLVDNLLSNALRHTPAGGTVSVDTVVDDDVVGLTVTDDGQGIPVAELDRVFERFYRVDQARSRDRGGSGLGLAVVRAIVTAHGGRVSAAARNGGGTVITVALPRHSASAQVPGDSPKG